MARLYGNADLMSARHPRTEAENTGFLAGLSFPDERTGGFLPCFPIREIVGIVKPDNESGASHLGEPRWLGKLEKSRVALDNDGGPWGHPSEGRIYAGVQFWWPFDRS